MAGHAAAYTSLQLGLPVAFCQDGSLLAVIERVGTEAELSRFSFIDEPPFVAVPQERDDTGAAAILRAAAARGKRRAETAATAPVGWLLLDNAGRGRAQSSP